jgi:hypothetical protein
MNGRSFLEHAPQSIAEEMKDPVAARLLPDYGSVFVARGGVTPPDRIIFRNENEVEEFQGSVEVGFVEFGEIKIELQKVAADALQQAVKAANAKRLSITPRSADSGRRSYADTVELWHSRVEPALVHWVTASRLPVEKADWIRTLSPFEQVSVIFELESEGLWFAKDLSKSIIYSVAPPGTSQHLSMLAFDVSEFNEPRVRDILAEYYWYQTVISDLPHFTFLDIPQGELLRVGLKKSINGDREFWVPEL